MFDFRLHLSNSCQHDCVRFALRPFLTTFEEQQKKAFFTISLIIWHKDMNIKILMGMSSYFLSTLPKNHTIREYKTIARDHCESRAIVFMLRYTEFICWPCQRGS